MDDYSYDDYELELEDGENFFTELYYDAVSSEVEDVPESVDSISELYYS